MHSIRTLLDERFEVTYSVKNTTEVFEYLICFPFKWNAEIIKNKSFIDLSEAGGEVSSYLSDLEKNIKNEKFLKIALDLIRSKNYLVYRDLFCLITRNGEEDVTNFSNQQKYFIFKRDNYYFFPIKILKNNKFYDKYTVKNLNYPYSNCQIERSKFACLNDCFKKGFKISKYFYNCSSETGLIQLDYKDNQTIREQEAKCFKECKHTFNCKIIYIVRNFNHKSKGEEIVYEASPLISQFDYFIQNIGLLFLFLSISTYKIISNLIEFASFKIKRLKKYFLITKIALVLCSVAYLLGLSIHMTKIYRYFIDNPIKKETTFSLFMPERIHLVICINIFNILKLNGSDAKEQFFDKTWQELELLTSDGFNKTIKEIYLEFQSKKLEVKWTLLSKVIFKNKHRCFEIVVDPYEPKVSIIISFCVFIIFN